MNCAPVSVSGGGSGADFGSLPDMAVFNIASKNDCRTTETKDVQFPHPGKYVEMSPGAKLAPPTGSCASGMASGETGEVSASPSRGGGKCLFVFWLELILMVCRRFFVRRFVW